MLEGELFKPEIQNNNLPFFSLALQRHRCQACLRPYPLNKNPEDRFFVLFELTKQEI